MVASQLCPASLVQIDVAGVDVTVSSAFGMDRGQSLGDLYIRREGEVNSRQALLQTLSRRILWGSSVMSIGH